MARRIPVQVNNETSIAGSQKVGNAFGSRRGAVCAMGEASRGQGDARMGGKVDRDVAHEIFVGLSLVSWASSDKTMPSLREK